MTGDKKRESARKGDPAGWCKELIFGGRSACVQILALPFFGRAWLVLSLSFPFCKVEKMIIPAF